MNSLQGSDILFRCSRLGDLITGSNGITKKQLEELERLEEKNKAGKITDKQIITLGQLLEKKLLAPSIGLTTKTFVRSLWLEHEFGYKEEFMTDEIMKGLLCEQDSLGLVQQVIGGEFRKKNTESFRNEFIKGTPDIVLKKEDTVEDTKTSFNLRTFTEAELTPLYEWQGQGYMWLTGKKNYRLIYCLVPTPDHIIESELRRWMWKFGGDEFNDHYLAVRDQILANNNVINQIPANQRVKVFEFQFDPEKIDLLKSKIAVCREYYDSLSLTEYGKLVATGNLEDISQP